MRYKKQFRKKIPALSEHMEKCLTSLIISSIILFT